MKTKLNWTQAEEEGEEEKELVVWLVECVDPSTLNEPEALAGGRHRANGGVFTDIIHLLVRLSAQTL